MKTMTCAQMGGMCDEKISGNTPDEIMANGMKHLEVTRPDMAKDIKSMPSEHPVMVEWKDKFMKEWEATPTA